MKQDRQYVIHSDLVSTLGLVDKVNCTSTIIRAVSTETLICDRETDLDIKINNQPLVITCVIIRQCNFPGDVLMGIDAMRQHQINVQPAELQLTMDNKTHSSDE